MSNAMDNANVTASYTYQKTTFPFAEYRGAESIPTLLAVIKSVFLFDPQVYLYDQNNKNVYNLEDKYELLTIENYPREEKDEGVELDYTINIAFLPTIRNQYTEVHFRKTSTITTLEETTIGNEQTRKTTPAKDVESTYEIIRDAVNE